VRAPGLPLLPFRTGHCSARSTSLAS
jgi:hypothetical protein